MKAQLADQGTEVRANTPESPGQFIRIEISRWAKVVKQSGIKVDWRTHRGGIRGAEDRLFRVQR